MKSFVPTKKEIEAGNRYHSYVRGWKDGAQPRVKNPAFEGHPLERFYNQGYEDGRKAAGRAMLFAEKTFKYKPSILR